MPKKILFLFILFCTFTVHAQFENTNSGATKKGNLSLLAKKTKTKKPTSIKVDASNGFKTAYKKRKKSKKEIEKALNNKGIIKQEDLFKKQIDKINKKFKLITSRNPFINQDLGKLKTNSKYIIITCRDFGDEDGDRIDIYLNKMLVVPNVLLFNKEQSFKIALEKGENEIIFYAINQGTSGANTAEFNIYNDSGSHIFSNGWYLGTGVQASLIIEKEE